MSRLNALIIEDDSVIAIDIMNILQEMNFTVVDIVDNKSDALNIATNNRIDMIVSDINLNREKDGIDICKELQILFNIPIIFVTAYKDDKTLIKASDVNSVGYLLKPFREDELMTLVKLAIHKYDLLKENTKISLGAYEYDKESKKLFLDELEIPLTPKEQTFISLLSSHQDGIIPYETLDNLIWQSQFVSDNSRYVFIHRISKKLSELNIQTEKNMGIYLNKLFL